jgi:hypothetical protein
MAAFLLLAVVLVLPWATGRASAADPPPVAASAPATVAVAASPAPTPAASPAPRTAVAPAPTPDEDYGPDDATPWLDDPLAWDRAIVDLSFLNECPAGGHGFVGAEGDHFVFADGSRARFWGCAVAANSCFGPPEQMRAMANRIAAFGFNLVRLHHLDVRPPAAGNAEKSWAGPSIVDYSAGNSLTLNAQAIDRVDYFISCLKEKGVYCTIDFQNLRQMSEGDGIRNLEEMRKIDRAGRYACYVDEDIQRNYQAFTKVLAEHLNPYTQLRWADDPVFAFASLTNENDFTFWPTRQVLANPAYRDMALQLARRAPPELHINPEEAVRLPSRDSSLFCVWAEESFGQRMIAAARSAGWQIPISNGNWAYGGLMSVIGKARSGDFLANHFAQGGGSFLLKDPARAPSLFNNFALTHVAGKPMVVGEWNVVPEKDEPAAPPHRAAAVLGMAAMAAHQGWGAVDLFCYRSYGTGPEARGESKFDSYLDPGILGVAPAAALLFRRDVSESPSATVFVFDEDKASTSRMDTRRSLVGPRTLQEKVKVSMAFGQAPTSATQSREYERNFLDGVTSVVSDTGQIRRDWQMGLQTIDTPTGQAAQGFYGGRHVALTDVAFDPVTPFSVIAVNSLSGEPIATSRRLLVTAIGATRRDAPKPGQPPHFASQTLAGAVTIRVKPERYQSIRVTPLQGDGTRLAPRTLRVRDHVVTLDLAIAPTHWFLLEAIQ